MTPWTWLRARTHRVDWPLAFVMVVVLVMAILIEHVIDGRHVAALHKDANTRTGLCAIYDGFPPPADPGYRATWDKAFGKGGIDCPPRTPPPTVTATPTVTPSSAKPRAHPPATRPPTVVTVTPPPGPTTTVTVTRTPRTTHTPSKHRTPQPRCTIFTVRLRSCPTIPPLPPMG